MDGLFILRESDPVTRLLPELAMEGNTIKVNKRLETNIPGVYAAGDCIGQPLQISKATGDGLVAVFGAADYLRKKADERLGFSFLDPCRPADRWLQWGKERSKDSRCRAC
mgnify:FL=1